jgi:glyoxylate/hydroxypyruvate reductase
MSLLFAAQHRDMTPFKEAIQKVDPNIDVEIWPGILKPERVQFAVAWNHPKNIFTQYPNLKVISSLGAGVDHLFEDQTIPKSIRFTRVVAPSLSDQMSDFVLTAVLNLFRNTEIYIEQQRKSEWKTHRTHSKKELTIGIMGLGELGRSVAERLMENGFIVNGWSINKKDLRGIDTFSGNELNLFLNKSNILVCLLPLTSVTDGILDLNIFKNLRKPAFLINAARGEHLVEEDLIYALDANLIEHAVLDVFTKEPLPASHPFWGRKKITITPHIASVTDPKEAAELIVENYKRLLSGIELLHEVDKNREY